MSDKKPWKDFPKIWSSEAKFTAYLRGIIRKGWSNNPVKLEFMKTQRIRGINPKTGRECYGFDCAICNKFHPQSEVQADHIVGNHSFKSVEDASSYMKAMFFVNFDSLQALCKGCHDIKTYSEKMNITFEQAKTEKRIIALMKDKKNVDKTLDSHNLPRNNDRTRKESLRKLIEEDKL